MSGPSGYLAPVRIVFRKTLPNPDDTIVLGDASKFLGHIFIKWVPAENHARVSVLSHIGSEEAESDVVTFPTPHEAGEKVLSLLRCSIATYKADQEAAIAAHLANMAEVDMPNLKVPVRNGFRPLSAGRVHAEFKERVAKEAQHFRSVITECLQQLVVAGWTVPTLVELPEFKIPNPWKARV